MVSLSHLLGISEGSGLTMDFREVLLTADFADLPARPAGWGNGERSPARFALPPRSAHCITSRPWTRTRSGLLDDVRRSASVKPDLEKSV